MDFLKEMMSTRESRAEFLSKVATREGLDEVLGRKNEESKPAKKAK